MVASTIPAIWRPLLPCESSAMSANNRPYQREGRCAGERAQPLEQEHRPHRLRRTTTNGAMNSVVIGKRYLYGKQRPYAVPAASSQRNAPPRRNTRRPDPGGTEMHTNRQQAAGQPVGRALRLMRNSGSPTLAGGWAPAGCALPSGSSAPFPGARALGREQEARAECAERKARASGANPRRRSSGWTGGPAVSRSERETAVSTRPFRPMVPGTRGAPLRDRIPADRLFARHPEADRPGVETHSGQASPGAERTKWRRR